MNIIQNKMDRDAYLVKLKQIQPKAFGFYDDPNNFQVQTHPALKQQNNSHKSLSAVSGPITDKQLIHLLRRTRPGFDKTEYTGFKGQNIADIVDVLLQEVPLLIPVNDYVSDEIIDNDIPLGESIVDAPYNVELEGPRNVSLKAWMIDHIIEQKQTIHNTMWVFWHNHLVVESWGIFNCRMVYKYYKLLHDHALGNFKTLMRLMVTDPAMLIYLNGAFNVKEAPDENFARELQELFCIGKGSNSQYTESDVQAAARVLTGWKLDWDGASSYFDPNDHDASDKVFSAFYGDRVIKGQTGENGTLETDELIDMLFDNDETARFICRKFYTFFVYASIDDWTEENIIGPMAETFRSNNYEIKPVLKLLLTSEHFFDEMNYGAMIKSPVDVLIGFWNAVNMKYSTPDTDIQNRALVRASMLWHMSEMGQQLGDPPNVAGWPAYYQVPTFDKSWVTTTSIIPRIRYTDGLIYWGFYSSGVIEKFDILSFVKTLENPGELNALIAELIELFIPLELSQSVVDKLKLIVLSGQTQDYYWTTAWNAYIGDPDNEGLKNLVQSRLRYLFQNFFQLAEYQLK